MTIHLSQTYKAPVTIGHTDWAVNLVIGDGHFSIAKGFLWICMG